jgi:hypothetical protein
LVRAAPFGFLTNSRKTERGAKQFPTGLVVRAAPFGFFDEIAQNGVRREAVSDRPWCAPHPLRSYLLIFWIGRTFRRTSGKRVIHAYDVRGYGVLGRHSLNGDNSGGGECEPER